MKVGDLVKFVGNASYYKGALGIITRMYNTHSIKKNGKYPPNSAIVYMPDRLKGRRLHGWDTPYFHPLGLNELEVIK